MTQRIKQEIVELVQRKKMKAALVIDEASLLRLEVFAELHTLTQFEQNSKPFLPIVLAGQSNLVDNLRYRNCLPLASRVVAKSHLKGSENVFCHNGRRFTSGGGHDGTSGQMIGFAEQTVGALNNTGSLGIPAAQEIGYIVPLFTKTTREDTP